jgi:hypothetical protein
VEKEDDQPASNLWRGEGISLMGVVGIVLRVAEAVYFRE